MRIIEGHKYPAATTLIKPGHNTLLGTSQPEKKSELSIVAPVCKGIFSSSVDFKS